MLVSGFWLLFQMGQFYYAAKAFDALEKLDPDSDYWEGKRGACVGVFQLILANKESKYASVLHLSQLSCIYPFSRGIVLDVVCRDVRPEPKPTSQLLLMGFAVKDIYIFDSVVLRVL